MIPDRRFLNQPRSFWANVRTIGQAVGYTVRGESQIRVPSYEEIIQAYSGLKLKHDHIVDGIGQPTTVGKTLHGYFVFRADRLNTFVEPRLMDVHRARQVFASLQRKLKPKAPIPMNRQKEEKKAPAYLTGIVNMLVEANAGGLSCDFDPRELTTVMRDGAPLRALARRVD